jgi:alpha-1,2-mannosyltransferase
MALQAFGMFILGLECILRFRPNIVIDTQGCAFAYPWFWIAAVPIVAYVHYPFISFDMISAVSDGRVTVNNSFIFAHSKILSVIKMQYYRLLAVIYGVCGAAASLAMVNSTWTQDHIRSLWRWTQCSLVYPPCDLSRMQAFDIQEEREPIIFSLAQFRPEKNQLLQVHILKRLFERRPEWSSSIKLIFYGGCRNKADEGRARAIEKLAEEIGIRVKFMGSLLIDRILLRFM